MTKKIILEFRLIVLAAIFMQVAIIQAQEDYQKQIDNIFEIPASKIPSGILLDRSPAILDLNGYDPTNKLQIDTCSLYKWMSIYYRLYASHLSLDAFRHDKNIAQQYLVPTRQKAEKISIAILFYGYDKLKADAMQTGLISVDTVNMKIRDVSGAGTPTEPATCFSFSPMSDTISAGNYSFNIDPSLFISNKTSFLQDLHIDFGDGQGYRKVFIGETVCITYFSTGNKTLRLNASWENQTLTAFAGLFVKQYENVNSESLILDEIPVPDFGPTKYSNNNIDAWYGIWYRCNHDNTIRKPLVLVSGFDSNDVNRIGDEEDNIGGKTKVYLYNVANKHKFLDKLRELGYDIIIYRSAHSTRSIVLNASNLANFITEKINAVKTSENELIVVGTSMGGLVARYTLAYMEQANNNYNHQTKLFMSVDAPQEGANIPLGFQFMAYYLNEDLLGSVGMLSKAVDEMLDCVSAKQMLLYHHTNTFGLTARCSSKRDEFLSSLSSVGNYPKKCINMAVSMGSGNGANQGFSAGASLIKKNSSPVAFGAMMTLDILFMLLGIPLGSTLGLTSWEFEASALPNQSRGTIYREELTAHICVPIIIIIWTPLPVPIVWLDCNPHIIDRKIEVNNTLPLDNAPGGTIGMHNLKALSLEGIGEVLDDLGVTTIDTHFDCFIPSYSALGLNVSPHTNIKSYLNGCAGVTKINNHFYYNSNKSVSFFDYLYIENANLRHIYDDNKQGVFTLEMLEAMEDVISSKNLYIENKTITSGQSIAYEASETISAGYSVDNIPTNNGDVIVQSGGSLDMKADRIFLKSGFYAKSGSNVRLKSDNSWVCPAGTIQSVSFSPLTNLEWEEVCEIQDPFRNEEQNFEEQRIPAIVQEMENEIRFFPNPVENLLNLQLINTKEGEIRITVFDMQGHYVYSQSIANDVNHIIDFSQFNSGVYFVNIAFKDSERTIKIIKN